MTVTKQILRALLVSVVITIGIVSLGHLLSYLFG
jgi:hypothetical protein